MSYNALTLTRDVLTLFVEAGRVHRRDDRLLAWAAWNTARLTRRDKLAGQPTILGSEGICRDGWRFQALPLNPPAPPRRTFGGLP